MAKRKSALESMGINNNFWRGKRVCLTGHTGFKGSWLAIWLNKLGAEVTGISLPPETTPNLFTFAKVEQLCNSYFCDIRNCEELALIIKKTQPEVVFHLAAQPLVRASYRMPVETFDTNVMGTVHILDGLRGMAEPRVAVMVTTDKVYRNNEWLWPYRENDPLGGHDPYSASKAASEIIIASYRDAFLAEQGIAVASARAGNVIGGGDWAEDRLIPDAVRTWQFGHVLNVRKPHAIRPWQHVLEPLAGYLKLAEKLWEQPALAGAYNFGPHSNEVFTVQEIIEHARSAYGTGEVQFVENNNDPHEAGWLGLESGKSRAMLDVAPKWSLTETVNRTMAWYRSQRQGSDALSLCLKEIADYEALS